jgi:hypothetical protein
MFHHQHCGTACAFYHATMVARERFFARANYYAMGEVFGTAECV